MDSCLSLPEDIESRLQLFTCSQIGALTYHKLIAQFGSAQACLSANSSELSRSGLNKAQIDALSSSTRKDIEPLLEWLESPENHILFSDQTEYPDALKAIYDPPPLLFAKGDWRLLNEPQVAMVGSRNATGAGKQNAFEFAASLARHGITITSGLASGIDTNAHQGALSTGKTIAVVGTGLDRVYPASNKALAESIVANGLIISEFNLGTRPNPGHFPKRNRIISALSLGTLVVEAAEKSGSLITAKHALEQSKEVFAIPGSIHSPLSKGCHQLIRQGAKLVDTTEDILFDLRTQLSEYIKESNSQTSTNSPVSQQGSQQDSQGLSIDHQNLLDAIDYEATTPDQIIQRTGLSSEAVSSILLILELKELITSEQGTYRRLS